MVWLQTHTPPLHHTHLDASKQGLDEGKELDAVHSLVPQELNIVRKHLTTNKIQKGAAYASKGLSSFLTTEA
jgi:hypothetical protein